LKKKCNAIINSRCIKNVTSEHPDYGIKSALNRNSGKRVEKRVKKIEEKKFKKK